MTTKGVEDGMGATRTCGCTGEFGCFICDIRGQRPRATPAMKDEVESATTAIPPGEAPEMMSRLYSALERIRHNAQRIFDKKPVRDWAETLSEADAALDAYEERRKPSPTLKDEVYAPIFAYSPTRQHKDSCPCVEFAVGDEICSMLCEHCTCKESQPAAVTEPSPQTKDEVYAMLAEYLPHGTGEVQVRQLWPVLEDAVKWRKR